MDQRLKKWRLLLGSPSDPGNHQPLSGKDVIIDNALTAVYDSDKKKGLGSSSPNINRWLGDIREYFNIPAVQMIQKDALHRLGLDRLLLEPELLETIEPDVELAATLLSLNKVMPAKTRETARIVINKMVTDLENKLREETREAIEGAVQKAIRNRLTKSPPIDWHRTIRANLKNYQPDLKTIVPEKIYGFGNKNHEKRHLILLIDQSGSMASSLVYASVFAGILSSLKCVQTSLIFFDTKVVDMTEQLHDPVEVLFGSTLGGGTDIGQALAYAQKLITHPSRTIVMLISDLYEGGNKQELLRRVTQIQASEAQLITLLALNDEGAPDFDHNIAGQFAAMDIPAFACTPHFFPDLMAAAIKKENLSKWSSKSFVN